MSRGRIPDFGQRLVGDNGQLTEESRLFLEALQGIIGSSIAFSYCVRTFDSLALLTAAIPNPDALAETPMVRVKGQGLAFWDRGASAWVLAADDTTPIV